MKICRSAFTMIELVFIVLTVGVLAAYASVKLASSRLDAVSVVLKSDIRVLMQSIPSNHFVQYDGVIWPTIEKAASIDLTYWKPAGLAGSQTLSSTLTDTQKPNGRACATLYYGSADANDTAADGNISVGNPILRIIVRGQNTQDTGCNPIRSMFPDGNMSLDYVHYLNLQPAVVTFH